MRRTYLGTPRWPIGAPRPRNIEDASSVMIEPSVFNFCIHCGVKLIELDKSCSECGWSPDPQYRMASRTETNASPCAKPSEEKRISNFCIHCGVKLVDLGKYCNKCGWSPDPLYRIASRTETKSSPCAEPSKKKQKTSHAADPTRVVPDSHEKQSARASSTWAHQVLAKISKAIAALPQSPPDLRRSALRALMKEYHPDKRNCSNRSFENIHDHELACVFIELKRRYDQLA